MWVGDRMTKFEQIGVERQLDCDSKREALKCFQHSCYVCCYKGMRLDCDKCLIAYVHNEVVAYFDDKNAKQQPIVNRKQKRF